MKRMIKITALLLMLVLTMGMVCGCMSSSCDGDDVVEKTAKLTIGLPYTSESPIWSDLQAMIKDFEFMYDAKVTLVTVPDRESKEYAKFIDQVYDGKIDMFLGESGEELEKLIEDGKIATAVAINKKDTRFYEGYIATYPDFSREQNRLNYSVPFNVSYQGLFLNKDVFEANKVALPTDWNSLLAAVDALKKAGVTPFAAGFADGANYWLEEMILVEGGVAEHSATPAKGVINSWSRAVKNIKDFYNSGAFSADALSNTHEIAVADFVNGKTAMILCSSMDLAGSMDHDNMLFMSFPKSPTGVKKDNTVIAKMESGFYINSKSLSINVDDVTALSTTMIGFITDYMCSTDYYSTMFAKEGTFPANTALTEVMDSTLETSVYQTMTTAPIMDMPMDMYMLTFEDMKSGLVDVLNGSVTAKDYLSTISQGEIKAQADKKAAELEEK